MMHAAVYRGNGQVVLEERRIPTPEDPRDAIVKVTLTSICTSDLHILHGAVPRARDRVVLGHEFVGEVVAAGDGLPDLKPGVRVAANCETFCGTCYFCKRGYVNNCRSGGWELGCRIDGSHAEFVRVPFADTGLVTWPDTVSVEAARFVGDILSSGYFAADLAAIRPADTVAVIGAGPVGLCAMQCARLFGAGRIVAVDRDPFRLDVARSHGLADTVVARRKGDAVRPGLDLTDNRGADAVIEAAGGDDTFDLAWRLARPNAVVALVAMYEEPQILPLPEMYGKNLQFKTGGVDAGHCAELVRLIAAGRLDTEFLITHRAPLNAIVDSYRRFESRPTGSLKWAVTPYER
ncbi:MAG: alcohol dehydrogenase [Planctomycetes bacterium]|nr:alcohol dehydrogenase [Planctomycetota bacterium]